MRNPTESETQRSGFEQAFQMLLMHRQDQEPLAWKPQCSSPARGPHHPGHTYLDITRCAYTPRTGAQEVLDVNGNSYKNESYFHCDEAAGYLKKPHRRIISSHKGSSCKEKTPLSFPAPLPQSGL